MSTISDQKTTQVTVDHTLPTETDRGHDLRIKLRSIALDLVQALPESERCSHKEALAEWPGPEPGHYDRRPLGSEVGYTWKGTGEQGSELLYARHSQKVFRGIIDARSRVPGPVWKAEVDDCLAPISLPPLLQSVTGQIAALTQHMTFCPDLSDYHRKVLSEHFKGLDTYSGRTASGVASRLDPKYLTGVKLTAADKAIMATIQGFADVLTEHDLHLTVDGKTCDGEEA